MSGGYVDRCIDLVNLFSRGTYGMCEILLISTFLSRKLGTDRFRNLQNEIDRIFNRFLEFTPALGSQVLFSENCTMTKKIKVSKEPFDA